MWSSNIRGRAGAKLKEYWKGPFSQQSRKAEKSKGPSELIYSIVLKTWVQWNAIPTIARCSAGSFPHDWGKLFSQELLVNLFLKCCTGATVSFPTKNSLSAEATESEREWTYALKDYRFRFCLITYWKWIENKKGRNQGSYYVWKIQNVVQEKEKWGICIFSWEWHLHNRNYVNTE